MTHLSVVIPVYQAEGCIHELYRRLKVCLDTIGSDFEILLIEDYGGDRSWQHICELAELDPRVKGIRFCRNFGQHYGITAGLDYCEGDWVVIMDCDLQDRPEEIPRLYEMALSGFDVVLARRGRRKDSVVKRVTSWMFYKIFRYLSDMDYDGQAGNFCIISKKVVMNFRNMRERLRFFGGLLSWMGFTTGYIDVQHDPRFDGKTSYTFGRLFKLASDTIVAHSDKPLRLAIKLGFIISALAFAYGSYIIYRATFHDAPIAGWSSLIVSLYFIGGVIISTLGVLGVYLGKVFDESKRRPLYIVSKTTF